MRTHRCIIIAAAIAALAVTTWIAACGDGGESDNGVPHTEAKSELGREMAPNVPDADRNALAGGNLGFAMDLYQQMRAAQPGNLIFSPFSASIALAMTYAGARGATESQMAATLHFALPQDRLHPAFNQAELALLERNKAADPASGKGFRLHMANSLWGQTGLAFNQSFLDTLAVNYGAGVFLTDFKGAPEAARQDVNSWVSKHTESRINDLIPPGIITVDTRFVLTNAIYFKASWTKPFNENATGDAPFHKLDGTQSTVKMMKQEATLSYGAGDGYQLVQIGYEGDAVAMTIVVPDAGRFAEVQGKLDQAWLSTALAGASSTLVVLGMPRFKFVSDFRLGEALRTLGMTDAFGAADFSGITSTEALMLQEVVQKAYIAVDEKGTEAAAATAVVGGLDGGAPPMPKQVQLDRPFLFFIRDLPTQALLFMGQVVEPPPQ